MMEFVQYREEPFVLSSGRLTNAFVDGRAIFDSPPHREMCLQFWESQIAWDRHRWHLVPVPTGGNRWAKALAERIGATWSERSFPGDFERIAVVEDVVTTGASARRRVVEVREVLGQPYMHVPVLAAVLRRAYVPPGMILVPWVRIALDDWEAT